MAAQDFFILHGEKVAVGVVGTLCAYLVINAFTNDGIRSTGGEGGISADIIKEDIQFIDTYRPKAKEPVLKAVPEYATRLKNDFTRIIPATPLMAWTTAHPDMGPGGSEDGGHVADKLSFAYVYEVLTPKLVLKDAIGTFEVSIVLPQSERSGDRISDKDEVTWSRQVGGNLENSADIAGAVIESQVGKGPWTPLNDGKILPFSEFSKGLSVSTIDYETYGFRARLAVRATGYRFDTSGGGEVLVANGRWVDIDSTPSEEQFKTLVGQINQKNAATMAKFLHPTQVEGVVLKPNESAYLSAQTDALVQRAQSPIKFQLLKLDPDPANPANSTATLLLTKLLRSNGKEGWVEVQQFKGLKPGAKLGELRQLVDPTTGVPLKVPVDLTTPFELVKVEKDVKRVHYHELKLVARADGKPGKMFDLRVKDKTTDTATFKNTRTGELLVLTKLDRIQRPGNPDAMITPDLLDVNEKEAFEKDAGAFVQQELLPPPPIKHAPDTGPLEELFKKGNKLAKTDTDYYEMPDGRLYYYEPNNKLVPPDVWKYGVTPRPKVEVPRPEIKAPEPVAPTPGRHPAPTPAGPPAGAPEGAMPHDGMPPGIMPPGAMPPGVMPPGAPPTSQPTTPRRR